MAAGDGAEISGAEVAEFGGGFIGKIPDCFRKILAYRIGFADAPFCIKI